MKDILPVKRVLTSGLNMSGFCAICVVFAVRRCCVAILLTMAVTALTTGHGPLSAEMATMHQVVSDGHLMAVWEKQPQKPTAVILLLHGRTWSSIPDFDLQVPGEELSLMDGLVEQGFAVYAMDARGYGATPRDETDWLTPDRASKDVAVVLEWIKDLHPDLARPVLFGWSYGSMVSQLCVQRNPQLVSAVVLFGYPIDPDIEMPELSTSGEPANKINTAEAAASDFIIPDSISQKAIQAYVKACLKADPVRVDWRNLHEWNELDPTSVKVPVLLIQGEFDPFAKTESHSKLFTRMGTSDRQWVVIPGGDHAAFMETPRPLFLHVLGGFVNRWKK